ncbi:MAG: hypothetical protein RIQ56_496, partial [Candidatus Parcubacteria bacterium]
MARATRATRVPLMRTHIILFLALALFPTLVSAHAIPIDSTPASSAMLEAMPREVAITFSERPDELASFIQVRGPRGNTVSEETARISPQDPKELIVAVPKADEGTYTVSWGVVSADDGHFSKGSFFFHVGSSTIATTTASADLQVVQIGAPPEIFAMTIELLGNGLLWGLLILSVLLRRTVGELKSSERLWLQKRRSFLVYIAASFAIVGGISQLLLKSFELSQLREISTHHAMSLYVQTNAGISGVTRILAIVLLVLVYHRARATLFANTRLTLTELLLFLTLGVFALARASISHATANPFFPTFSVLINFFHLIEKDTWAGIVLILLLVSLSARALQLLPDLIPKAFKLLGLLLLGISVSASYIVWLHLKHFGNLFSTSWGTACITLGVFAFLLLISRTANSLLVVYRKQWLMSRLTLLLGVETIFALIVLYVSSLVIITSPPKSLPPDYRMQWDEGVSISLERAPYEDGMLKLTTSSALPPSAAVGSLTSSEEGVAVPLVQRSTYSYVFPDTVIPNEEMYLTITSPTLHG